MDDRLPPPPTASPDLDDDFAEGPDPAVWFAEYLPHWTTPDRSAARWRVSPGGVDLLIEAEQPDWRPEDPPLRVSNLQTGVFSGPVGSAAGIHPHRPDLVVRTATPLDLRWAPSRGRVDVTLTASSDPGCMTAAWLVGVGVEPVDSGEICLVEIDSDAASPGSTVVRMGIKAHTDPRLPTDMAEVTVPFDATSRPSTWTAIWGDGQTVLGCDGVVLRRLAYAPAYLLVLLVDLFEIGAPSGDHPKRATIRRVTGWSG